MSVHKPALNTLLDSGASAPALDPQPGTPRRIHVGRFTIEVVPIVLLDLLEKNARYMRAETLKRLVENIKADGQLSQLPFCLKREDGRFLVLSGNHRVKAARQAGLDEIPIMYTDEPLSKDQQIAIQLSHNAIAGEDDPVILKELWSELADVKLKMYSGLDDKMLGALLKAPLPALSEVRLDFRTTTFLFLPNEIDRVKAAFTDAKSLLKADSVLLARLADYDRLLDAVAETNAAYNITNGATGLLCVLEVFERHRTDLADGWYDAEQEAVKHKHWVPLSSIFGTATVPADAALVMKQAVDKMLANGDVEPSSRWQAIERWSADYLAGV